MDNLFEEGDKVKVKLIGVDPKSGKFKLSRKALLPKPDNAGGDGDQQRGGGDQHRGGGDQHRGGGGHHRRD